MDVDVTTGTSIFSPHSSNCSVAPALNVSPATKRGCLPSFFSLLANFPIVVVFPTPLTPTKRIMVGGVSLKFILLDVTLPSTYIINSSSMITSFNTSVSSIFSFFTLSFNLSTNFTTVFIPISDIMRMSSNSSKYSSPTNLYFLERLFSSETKFFLVFAKPFS